MKNLKIIALFFCTASFADNQLNEYTIPVSPELTKWATFIVEDAHLRIRKGEAKLEYSMPPELAGEEPLKLEAKGMFESFETPLVLSGTFIKSATCHLSGDLARCQIVYRNQLPSLMPGGREAVAEYLRKTVSKPEDLEMRLQVLDQFVQGPPSGITDGHEAGGKFERLRVRFK